METTRQALVDDTSVVVMLYMALELSGAKWKVAIGDGKRAPSQHTLKAADVLGLLGVIEKAKKRCGLSGPVRVMSCYEAGRDGFWLHRWAHEQGIDNVVVDSSSIEVNRRARRAKSDGLDAAKLYEMLVRYVGGETRVWRVVRVPTAEQEDARRLHRELERLKKERNAHVSRMGSLAVLHNVRLERIGGRDWQQRLEGLQGRLPAALWQEIARESRRLELVSTQIGAVERRAPRAAGGDAQTGRAAGRADAAARHRGAKCLGAGARAVWLAPLCQPSRAGRLRGGEPQSLRQRGQRARAGHQQGGQPARA